MADKEVRVKVTAQDATGSTLGRILGGFKSFAASAAGVFAGIGASFGAVAFGNFFKSSVEQAAQASLSLQQLGQAVTNAGGDFSVLRPNIDATIKSLQRLNAVEDDDARAALGRLISVSNDYAGSLKNMQLVLDLAAAKHLDLDTAATLVGKAMVGNTATLGRYGIVVKDGADSIQLMRDRFQGFAEGEAKTLSGRLKQLSIQWTEVKKAVGNAILGNAEAGKSVTGLTGVLVDLEGWIVKNEDGLQRFTTLLASAASGAVKLAGSIGNLIASTSTMGETLAQQGILTGGPFNPTPGGEGRLPRPGGAATGHPTPAKTAPAAPTERIPTRFNPQGEAIAKEIAALAELQKSQSLQQKDLDRIASLEASLTAVTEDGTRSLEDRAAATKLLTQLEGDRQKQLDAILAKQHEARAADYNKKTETFGILGAPSEAAAPSSDVPGVLQGVGLDPVAQAENARRQQGGEMVDAASGADQATDAITSLHGAIDDLGNGALAGLKEGLADATLGFLGLGSAAEAGGKGVIGSIGKVVKAKGTATVAEGAVKLADAIFPPNPALALSGAEMIVKGGLLAALGGGLAGGGGGGAGGYSGGFSAGTGGLSPGRFEQNQQAAMESQGTVTVVLRDGYVRTSDPAFHQFIADTIKSASGRRVIFVNGVA